MNPIVEITALEKQMDTFHLGPLDAKIYPGTITTLIGNNNTGKSTILKIMMNLVKADKGNVKLFSTATNGLDENWKRKVAYFPQKAIGYDPFTGNTLKDMISNCYSNWDEELFQHIVQIFHIPLDKKYSKLSPGAQQKLRIALTLPRDTQLLLLDEPTAFMDIPAKMLLTDLLVDWMEEDNRSIIISSHQIEEIKKLSDFLFVLHNGKYIGTFEKESLTENYFRYWLTKEASDITIPGKISLQGRELISNHPEETEQFLLHHDISWLDRKALDLEEIIHLFLK